MSDANSIGGNIYTTPREGSPFYSIVMHPLFLCAMCDMRYDTFASIEGHLKENHKVTHQITPPPALPR